jgi:UTP-glucose-1-phosphate uridylyltransferase
LDTMMKKILDALDDEHIEALVEAIKKAGIWKLSIIVDGLWEGIADLFVQSIIEAVPEFKVPITSRHNTLKNIPDEMFCIEYNKERQSLYIPHPYV